MTLSGKMILEKEVLFIVQGLRIQTPKKLILLLLEALICIINLNICFSKINDINRNANEVKIF